MKENPAEELRALYKLQSFHSARMLKSTKEVNFEFPELKENTRSKNHQQASHLSGQDKTNYQGEAHLSCSGTLDRRYVCTGP